MLRIQASLGMLRAVGVASLRPSTQIRAVALSRYEMPRLGANPDRRYGASLRITRLKV